MMDEEYCVASAPGMSFGELLQRYRGAAGLTQEALAERAGLSARGISDLEHGLRRAPYSITTHRLAEALGLSDEQRERLVQASARRSSASDQPIEPAKAASSASVVSAAHPQTDTVTLLYASLADRSGRSLERRSIEEHAGRLIDDDQAGVAGAFAHARDAVAAALAAQRSLRSGTDGFQVQMGLHSGPGDRHKTPDVGSPLQRCAALAALGHMGQVLVTSTTRQLVEEALPAGASLRDLGRRRLADLASPEHVFQLVHAELPADFPPLRSLDPVATNLPVQSTRFVGRERELAALHELVVEHRLVTVSGTGGVGKTRLALQVAAHLAEMFEDGVWLVEMSSVPDAALIPQAIVSILSVREQPGQPAATSLVEYVRTRHLLLLLDSCEHVVRACGELVNTLLQAAPWLHILVTSREVLAVDGEVTWRVPSLSLPPSPAPPSVEVAQYEAVGLFLERASASNSHFRLTKRNTPAIVEICHRLDGIPLAIVLAAARVGLLSPEQIATRLDDRFHLLTARRTAIRRQQTLRALIDWSHELLDETERILFRRLSVFAGGFALEAVEQVCADERTVLADEVLDVLGRLVDKSLVQADAVAEGAPRFRMLETLRRYAHQKLEDASEVTLYRQLHLLWCTFLAQPADDEVASVEEAWFATLELELENLRQALTWARASGAWNLGLRLASALWPYWEARGYYSEGGQWLTAVLEGAGNGPEASVPLARATHGLGVLSWHQGDYAQATAALNTSLTG